MERLPVSRLELYAPSSLSGFGAGNGSEFIFAVPVPATSKPEAKRVTMMEVSGNETQMILLLLVTTANWPLRSPLGPLIGVNWLVRCALDRY
jgi:hypothetical protein